MTLDLARLVRPWVAVLILVLVGASCRSSEPETAGGADPGVGSAVDRAPAPTVERGDDGVPDGTYEWSTLPIGGGGWVTGISLHPTDPDAVYVRTDVAGAYRYVAGENRWEQMIHASSVSTAISSGDYAVESIAAAPSDSQTVYLSVGDDPVEGTEAGEGTGRVLSSTDGGTTWSASNKRWVVAGNGFQRQRSERLAVDPKDSLHVLLGTRREGLWQSTDGGVTWAVVDGLPRGSDDAGVGVTFVVWGTGTLDGVVWAGVAGQGVYQSENDGASWRRIRTVDADVGPFEGVVVDGRLLVAFNRLFDTGAGSLELFDAHARVWTDISPLHDRPAWSAAAVPQKPSSLVASDSAVREGHLWWSSDGGATWTSVDIGVEAVDVPWLGDSDIDSWMSIGRLAFDPHEEGRLWFAEGMGVWTAPEVIGEGSVTWQERSRGLELTVAADLVAPPNGVPLSAVADRQGFRHEDPAYYPLSTLVDDRFGGGTSLDYSAGHPEAVVWVGADYTSPDDSRTSRGAISSDGGDTWREFESLDRSQFGGNVAVSATDPDNIVWVPSHASVEEGDRPGAVFISTDGGRSWTETEGVSRTSRYHRLVWWLSRRALASDRVDGGVFYLVDDEGRFAVSADGGRTWDQAAEGPPCSQANDCHVVGQLRAAPDRAGEIWSSVGSDGLFRTSDRGASEWEQVPGVVEARAFDFGAPLPGSTEPVVYLYGRVGDDPDLAVWRSSDRGVTWAMIARHPQGLARLVNVVSGDLSRPGRVYIGFAGLGFVYGDDPSLSTE